MSSPPQKKRKIAVQDWEVSSDEPSTSFQAEAQTTKQMIAEAEQHESAFSYKFPPSSLMSAVLMGNLKRVEALILAGASINSLDESGHSVLASAALCGHDGIVRLLLNANASVDSICDDLAAVKSCFSSESSVVDLLLDIGRNPHKRNADGLTALEWAKSKGNTVLAEMLLLARESADATRWKYLVNDAARHGKTDIVELLLDARAPLDVEETLDDHFRDSMMIYSIHCLFPPSTECYFERHLQQHTALIWAVKNGHVDVVRAMSSHGQAVVDYRDNNGMTALVWAVKCDQVEAARVLVDAGADIHPRKHHWMIRPRHHLLSMAAEGSSVEMTKLLISAKANLDPGRTLAKPALAIASSRGKADIVKELLKANAKIEEKSDGMTAVAHAVKHSHIDVMKVLAAAGADVNARVEPEERTLLMLAAARGDHAVVRTLIELGAEIHARDGDDRCALGVAAKNGHIRCMKLLIAAKATLDAPNDDDETMLMEAADSGNADVVLELLSAGADLHVCDGSKRAALSFASSAEIANALIAARADVNLRDRYGCTPLMHAARRGRADVVKTLLNEGADVNDRSCSGMSALLESLEVHGFEDHIDKCTVETLLMANADIEAVDQHGVGALHLAVYHREVDASLVEMLLSVDSSTRINVQNHCDMSPLMLAIDCGHVDVASLFISHGANINKRNRWGTTALIMAVYQDNCRAVKILLDAGAHWESQHPRERNAFVWACEGRRRDFDFVKMTQLLIDAKADVNARSSICEYPSRAAKGSFWILGSHVNASEQYNGRFQETALMAAVETGARDIVTLLLQSKADVNMMDLRRDTALKRSVENQDVETAKLLVAAGAKAEIGYDADTSPLSTALDMYEMSSDMVRVLLEGKADVCKFKNGRFFWNSLEVAVNQGKASALKHLSDAGLDLSQPPHVGTCLLEEAIRKRNIDMLRVLIDAKAPINAEIPSERPGKTPLIAAIFGNRIRDYEVIEMLLTAGARVDACVHRGMSLLSNSDVQQNPRLFKTLLRALCRQTGYLEPLEKIENQEADSNPLPPYEELEFDEYGCRYRYRDDVDEEPDYMDECPTCGVDGCSRRDHYGLPYSDDD